MSGPDLRSIAEVAPLVRSGSLAPAVLVESCLAQIEARPEVNAYITVLAERAREEAGIAAREIAAGRWRGPLHGIPIAVKDLIDVAGTPTTSASAVPATDAAADAPVIARLRAAGAIILGKTNLHEFAFGTTSDETAFGPVTHPRDARYSAGGSSGGSAAALAAGMAYGALGTDTGGSIRIPSAVCGTVGLKAAFEDLPCDGVVPLSTTLDHVGPMTRTVEDAALLYAAMRGEPAGELTPAANGQRFTFGVPRPYFTDVLDGTVRAAFEETVAALRAGGHTVMDLQIEHAAWTPDVYLHIVLPEASWYHAPVMDRDPSGYSPGVRLRLDMGRYVLAEDYVRAMDMRKVLTREVDAALARCDGLLLPALAITAPPLHAATVDVDGTPHPVRAVMLRLTQLFNLTGHPAVALPAPDAGGDSWPTGVQVVGPAHDTARAIALARAVEAQISGAGSVGGGTG